MAGGDPLRPLLVELPFTVKTYDIDFANIVHNLVYIRWLEDLRLALIAPYLSLASLLEAAIGPILEQTDIRYRRAVRFGDRVLGRMWLAEATRVRWAVGAEFVVEGDVAASAAQRGYFLDLQRFVPVALPQPLRDAWRAAAPAGARGH